MTVENRPDLQGSVYFMRYHTANKQEAAHLLLRNRASAVYIFVAKLFSLAVIT